MTLNILERIPSLSKLEGNIALTSCLLGGDCLVVLGVATSAGVAIGAGRGLMTGELGAEGELVSL